MLDVVYSTPFIGLIVIGFAMLGFFFLSLLLLLFFSRGGQMISGKAGGAIALTVATMMLLSGLWCIFLSPEITQTEWRDSFYNQIAITEKSSWKYPVDVVKEDMIDGSVNLEILYREELSITEKIVIPVFDNTQSFNLFIYDPDDEVIWSQINVTYAYFTINAFKIGVYEIEVYNPGEETIQCYISFNIRRKVTLRPLEGFGQWLTLISLPVYGLGIWATGYLNHQIKRKARSH